MINSDGGILTGAGKVGVTAGPEGEPGDGAVVCHILGQDCPLPPAPTRAPGEEVNVSTVQPSSHQVPSISTIKCPLQKFYRIFMCAFVVFGAWINECR